MINENNIDSAKKHKNCGKNMEIIIFSSDENLIKMFKNIPIGI